MKKSPAFLTIFTSLLIIAGTACSQKSPPKEEWTDLFNGRDLSGWTASENSGSFRVDGGQIVANGERSHLFYTGDVAKGEFKNFEFKTQVMTTSLANSGIYFHTAYQEEGWPNIGYEAQVNNTHIGGGDYRELKKTGSLYGVRNTYKQLVPDSTWFQYHIKVVGSRIQIRINDVLVVNYLQPAPDSAGQARYQGQGTFALQGHDPGSTVYFKDIQVHLLDEVAQDLTNPVILNETYSKMMDLQSRQFAFIDLGVEMNDRFDLQQLMAFYYRTGINLGVVLDAPEYDQLDSLTNYPMFVGARYTEGSDLSQFDYIVGDAGNYTGDTSAEAYVKSIEDDLKSKNLDVWSNATRLPESVDDHVSIWTGERMDRIITAAMTNNVAIEINNQTKLPGIAFLKRAKELGASFTYSGLGVNNSMGELDYIFQVIDSCGLDYKDLYIPAYINRR